MGAEWDKAFALSILIPRLAGIRALILCLVNRGESVVGLQGEREGRTGHADRLSVHKRHRGGTPIPASPPRH
jgi:hypothetical protein